MNKDVFISITGRQHTGEDTNVTELVTEGKYYTEDGKYFLSYLENDFGESGATTTTLKIEADGVITLTRGGASGSLMVFEKGRRHLGHYETEFGSFTVGVSSNSVKVRIDEKGGEIAIDYVLDINNITRARNDLCLKIKEA